MSLDLGLKQDDSQISLNAGYAKDQERGDFMANKLKN